MEKAVPRQMLAMMMASMGVVYSQSWLSPKWCKKVSSVPPW